MRRLFVFLLAALLLCGCAGQQEPGYITVSLSLPRGCSVAENGLQIISGQDAVFELILEDGYALAAVDYPGGYTTETKNGKLYLRLQQVRYPAKVAVELTSSYCSIRYEPNGGQGNAQQRAYDKRLHLRPNTANGQGLFTREGYTLTGWNTMPDGSGQAVGLGSRVSVPEASITLYAQWAKWTDEAQFSWETTDDGVRITGYQGADQTLVIPEKLGGGAVTAVAAGAFHHCKATHIILPSTLKELEDGAFTGCNLKELTLFDNIETFGDDAFVDCPDFSTVHINAVEAPYGYAYRQESCFADKVDLLLEAQGQQKMVFYGGCSIWYNLDGRLAQNTLGDSYRVINMGLNGVINSSAQMQILTHFLEEGDILFHTPEISSQPQLMIRTQMIDHDRKLWSGLEYNYDLAALLDIRTLPEFFDIFQYWLREKKCISSYTDIYHDTKGNYYVDEFGCIPFNRQDTAPELVDTVYLDPSYMDPAALGRLEDHYRVILNKNVKIYVGYACVNMDAVPWEQQGNVAMMDGLFRDAFSQMEGISVIGKLSQHLYHNGDFYDTNYHLLSEPARYNTLVWLEGLEAQMRQDGLWPETK